MRKVILHIVIIPVIFPNIYVTLIFITSLPVCNIKKLMLAANMKNIDLYLYTFKIVYKNIYVMKKKMLKKGVKMH